MSTVSADPHYGDHEFAAEFAALLDAGRICVPDDPDAPGGPVLLDEHDVLDPDPCPQMSRVDALEWELWAGVDQDEAERTMLEQKAPPWVFLPPGAELAAALEQVRPQTESPVALIEVMKAATRMIAWAESIKNDAVASFYRQRQASDLPRPSQVDSRGRPVDPERSWAGEIAAALTLSPDTVHAHIDTALRLTSVLKATHTAMRCGAVTMSKALAIVNATRTLTPAAARAVEAHVLKRAPQQTLTNLNASLRKQVAKHTTKESAAAHKDAKKERGVRIVPLANGMAGLWIVNTADKIQEMWVVIQAMATIAKRGTPTPTPPTATGSPAPSAPTATGDQSASTATDTPGTTTTSPTGTAPETAAPEPAPTAPAPTAPEPAPTAPEPAPTAPEPAAPAPATPAPATPESAAPEPAPVPGREDRTADQRRADVVGDLFEFMLFNGLDWLGRRLPDQQRRRPHIEVLTPINTLLGLDDDPCHLTGYGPIPADLARRIATDGTWRRILTDPTNGQVLEASTTRHDPGAMVSETLLAAHPVCDWINCNRPARESDRDHGIPFAQTGTTNLADLRIYCELHHVIKDTPAWGWKATNNPDGSTTLTTPTGHRYTTVPPAPGPITRPDPPPPDEDPPPF